MPDCRRESSMTRTGPLYRAFPWGIESGIRSTVLTIACSIGLVLTWLGVADRGVVANQVPWLSAGIAIEMLALYAQVSLVFRARRTIGDRRVRLLSNTLLHVEVKLTDASTPISGPEVAEASRVLVVGAPGMYHDPACPMTFGKPTSVMSRGEDQDGSVPCGICIRPVKSVDSQTNRTK
jgi:hypothetical protein